MKLKSNVTAKGHFTITVFDVKTGRLKRTVGPLPNAVLNQGLELIAAQHAGTTNDLEITTLELGDDGTTPAATDTALANATKTGVVPAKSVASGRTVTVSFFLNDADLANGTYRELGVKVGSTLYTRALITPAYTKASNENTRIDYTITYSSS